MSQIKKASNTAFNLVGQYMDGSWWEQHHLTVDTYEQAKELALQGAKHDERIMSATVEEIDLDTFDVVGSVQVFRRE